MGYGKITAKQQEILDYIKDEILKRGYPPTVREICETVNLKSTSSVHSHLETLEKNGYIQCRKEKSPLGPIRKYYSVTDAGTKHLKEFRESYKSITESAKKILRMEE